MIVLWYETNVPFLQLSHFTFFYVFGKSCFLKLMMIYIGVGVFIYWISFVLTNAAMLNF